MGGIRRGGSRAAVACVVFFAVWLVYLVYFEPLDLAPQGRVVLAFVGGVVGLLAGWLVARRYRTRFLQAALGKELPAIEPVATVAVIAVLVAWLYWTDLFGRAFQLVTILLVGCFTTLVGRFWIASLLAERRAERLVAEGRETIGPDDPAKWAEMARQDEMNREARVAASWTFAGAGVLILLLVGVGVLALRWLAP